MATPRIVASKFNDNGNPVRLHIWSAADAIDVVINEAKMIAPLGDLVTHMILAHYCAVSIESLRDGVLTTSQQYTENAKIIAAVRGYFGTAQINGFEIVHEFGVASSDDNDNDEWMPGRAGVQFPVCAIGSDVINPTCFLGIQA